uniref:Uncharacterized protein n=1 Tax=Triticum urartu TaxID=4572 RepID=A0A8R7UKN9_TRIUA
PPSAWNDGNERPHVLHTNSSPPARRIFLLRSATAPRQSERARVTACWSAASALCCFVIASRIRGICGKRSTTYWGHTGWVQRKPEAVG